MKYLKKFEARIYKKEITSPVADFLYDKFFGDIGHSVLTKDKNIKKTSNIFNIIVRLSFYSPMRVEYLETIKDIGIFMKPYLKREKDLEFYFGWRNEINFNIKLTRENVEKLKELEEFKQWEDKNKEGHDLFILQKYITKKYNL